MASSSSPLADRLKHIVLDSTARGARASRSALKPALIYYHMTVLLISREEHLPLALARTGFPNQKQAWEGLEPTPCVQVENKRE